MNLSELYKNNQKLNDLRQKPPAKLSLMQMLCNI